MALIDKVRTACRIASLTYDDELTDLISAALADLGLTDIKASMVASTDNLNTLIQRAVITYCKMNFGYLDSVQYDKFKKSYDEQKSQLLMSSSFTEWGETSA